MDQPSNVEEVMSEHRALKSLFSRIQQEFDRPIVCTRVLHEMLSDATVKISVHFEREEQGGFFAQIVARLPDLQPQVERLIAQHTEFRERLPKIAGGLAQSTEETLFDLSREFDAFLTDYFKHEGRENQLAREAFGGKPPGQ